MNKDTLKLLMLSLNGQQLCNLMEGNSHPLENTLLGLNRVNCPDLVMVLLLLKRFIMFQLCLHFPVWLVY